MAKHFLDLGDDGMASKFRPSSMEGIRKISTEFGVDTLTLVSEMPLFIGSKTDDASALKPMPIMDQMALQWVFVASGIRISRIKDSPLGN